VLKSQLLTEFKNLNITVDLDYLPV